ncbi:MAG: hypothetical protein Q8P95_05535 [bacterium]|nr:hypothetical protein [bacterium]
MRFVILLVLTIFLLKLFVPEIAEPFLEIVSNLLQMLALFLKELLSSVNVA